MRFIFIFLILFIFPREGQEILLPIQTSNRSQVGTLSLTNIGAFGIVRKARPSVKEHLHTGIDIKRPSQNYQNEWIYPIAKGVVMSKRDDGPFAQLIIAHKGKSLTFWTVYEHIAGIKADVGEEVDPLKPMARFMNKEELNRYGWQFDHFHLEILKEAPFPLKPDQRNPQRLFSSYTLQCYSEKDLNRYFYNPIDFLSKLE